MKKMIIMMAMMLSMAVASGKGHCTFAQNVTNLKRSDYPVRIVTLKGMIDAYTAVQDIQGIGIIEDENLVSRHWNWAN